MIEIRVGGQDSTLINPVRKAKRTSPGISKMSRRAINFERWYSTVLSLTFRMQSDGFGGLAFGQQLEDFELARGNCSSGLAERAICCRGKFLTNWRPIPG